MKFTVLPVLALGAVPAFAKPGFSFWSTSLVKRETTDPNVNYPHTGTVWFNGTVHNVTWSTEGISPPTCGAVINTALYLANMGSIPDDGSVGSMTNPIATNFSLSRGRIEIMTPNVTSGGDYQIVLKADTSDTSDEGNFSGTFFITNSTSS